MSLKINKKIVFIIIICVLTAASFAAFIFYFRSRDLKLNSQLGSLKANLEKVTKDYAQANKDYIEVREKYKKLTTDFEGLSRERDNLLI
ncbi:MAG: hypothetical protein NT066_02305, partial [Candidatus Omnitrophica bacterium]|nr:hypothetical protein [Candidatus Omnitrophota bacterium]